MLLISQILIWVSILVLAGAVLALARQVGVLHERIAPVGALAIAKGPQAGEAAPKVSGRTLAGTNIEVAGPLPPGQLRLLFFVSPTCPVCKNLLPTAVKFAATEVLDLILVGDGEDADYQSMAERYGIAPDRFINSALVGRAFHVGKLPYAVLISELGIIVAQGLVNTREHLESLIVAHETGLSSVQEYIKARKSRIAVSVAALLLLGSQPSTRAIAGENADLLLLQGKVITVDSQDTIAEAVAIKDGRILAVGSNAEIQKYAGPTTQVVKLNGKAVLPGFIDAHTHLEGIAAFHRMLDVHAPPLKGVEEILQKVQARARAAKPGEWIIGAGGWGQVLPTRQQLDAIAPANPVVLRESAHVQILNSAALRELGINKGYQPPRGGHVFTDPKTGEPTGKIQEMPGVWADKVPAPTYAARRQSLKEVMENFRSMGVTTVYDFPSGDGMKIYQDMRDAGQLPIRLRYQIILTGQPATFGDFVINYGPRTGFGDDWLRLGGIKLFVDGETESAVRYEPAGQRQKWVGDVRYTQQELNDLVMRAHKAGFQVWTHALGDKAQDMILDAYEAAEKADPRPDPRHRIEHAGNQEAGPTTAEQLDRMKRLGVIPVPTGAWIYLGHAAFKTQAQVPFIYKTMLAHGLRPPGTSDSVGSMPESMSPFFSMWAIVTRKTRGGELNGPSEAISIRQAIRSYTIDGAYSGFEEKLKGSIEPGKLADLNVLSADPLTVPPDQIKDIQVVSTVLDGKVVHSP